MASPMRKKLKKIKKARGNNKTEKEEAEIKKMAELILAEAGKMAKLQGRKAAEEVLLEATALARWMRRPFYIV